MDSVTQITLGAAVGEAVGGRKAGAKAPMWGAFLGTLPDLDILANPFLTEAQALTFHRSLSHSFVFVAVVTLLAALGLRRLHRDAPVSGWRWAGLTAAVLLTHVGLDCLTSYGTQVFWPFSRYPVILGTIFVIDPFYTIPLAAGLLASLWWSPTSRTRRWANYAGLAVSSAYLFLTIGNKLHVHHVFEEALARQVPPAERVFTRPTPFNNLLWHGIAEAEDGYYVGFYSLLDGDRRIDFRFVPKHHDLLGTAADNPVVERLRRFSRGYFAVRRSAEGSLLIYDLRFGRNDLGLTEEGEYLFTFRLQENPEGTVVGLQQEEPPLRLDGLLLRRFVARIRGNTEVDTVSAAGETEKLPRGTLVRVPSLGLTGHQDRSIRNIHPRAPGRGILWRPRNARPITLISLHCPPRHPTSHGTCLVRGFRNSAVLVCGRLHERPFL